MSNDRIHQENDRFGKNLLWATFLNVLITIFQIAGGLLSNSLALISDAIHNLGDALAVFIAFVANKISQKDPTQKKTFGFKRIEILAALLNALILIIICAVLVYESIERFREPEPIRGDIMFAVAIIGFLANMIAVFILHKDSKKNVNIKAAYLHLLGDTISSVAVIGVGIIIYYKNVVWLDPAITIAISIYIAYHTYAIIKETVNILMQGVPAKLNINKIKESIEAYDEVSNIHHVHIWNLNDREIHFECHIETNSNFRLSEINKIRDRIEKDLKQKYNIGHFTLQFEYEACKGDALIAK